MSNVFFSILHQFLSKLFSLIIIISLKYLVIALTNVLSSILYTRIGLLLLIYGCGSSPFDKRMQSFCPEYFKETMLGLNKSKFPCNRIGSNIFPLFQHYSPSISLIAHLLFTVTLFFYIIYCMTTRCHTVKVKKDFSSKSHNILTSL